MSGKAIRETLAVLGVTASMVFVGLEIRQSNMQARAAAYQAIGIATSEWFDNMAHDREFVSTLGKGAAAMDTTDWRQAGYRMTAIARMGETVWLQVEQRRRPPDAMERLGYSGWKLIFQAPDPVFGCLWPLIRPGVSASFRQFVEEGQDVNALDCGEYAIPATL